MVLTVNLWFTHFIFEDFDFVCGSEKVQSAFFWPQLTFGLAVGCLCVCYKFVSEKGLLVSSCFLDDVRESKWWESDNKNFWENSYFLN